MPFVPAKCTQCGANITVDDSKDAAICEFCGTAFITEKVINNYNVINNFNIANAQITVSGIDVSKRIAAAEKLMNSGLIDEGKRMLLQITKDCPEDYRPWFLLAKYAYELDGEWFDNNPQFSKAKALADEDGLAVITEHYNEMYARIISESKDVIDFCANADLSKLYYCYIKWYFSEKLTEESGYGYCGFEPVNGMPTIVSYGRNDKYGYVRRELATNCKVELKIHKKRMVGIITSDSNSFRLMWYVRNQLHNCSLFISDFVSGKVIYNGNPSEMVYGNQFHHQSTDFEKTSSGCYVATAVYGSYDCPEVWTLRRFRDIILAPKWYGRAFIRTYYAISPTIVKWFGDTEWFKMLWKPALNRLVTKLNKKGVENTPYNDR